MDEWRIRMLDGASTMLTSILPNAEYVMSLFVMTISSFGIPMEIVTLVLFLSLMSLVAVIDWNHMIIPNEIVLVALIVGVLVNLAQGASAILDAVLASIYAFVSLFIVRLAGSVVLKQEAMGFGDVKLAAVIGLFLGFPSFVVAVWGAAVAGLLWKFVSSVSTLSTPSVSRSAVGQQITGRLPFGSFLAAVSSILLVFRQSISNLIDQWLMFIQ